MAPGEVHVELLLGRVVRDVEGRAVGHLEEVRAERVGGELLVSEYLTGAFGAATRLGLGDLPLAALGVLGLRLGGGGYRIRWDQLELTDPERPRTRCRKEELRRRDG